jgi:Ca2+-binding RTX toxin-like protein
MRGHGAYDGDVDTVLIVDDSDDVTTAGGSDGNTLVSISEPASFAPGKTGESGELSEIEFLVDTKAGRDQLVLGGTARQQLIVGNDGAAWNSDADAEIGGMPFDALLLHAADGADHISGQGGAGTGAPLSTAAAVQIYGGNGADSLFGSYVANGDVIVAGDGADSVIAYGGDDAVLSGPGDDAVQGGTGTDTLDFDGASSGITVDLADTGIQDTGEGSDSFVGFENASGSFYADRLSGSSAANVLTGGNGDDTLEGRGGTDERVEKRAPTPSPMPTPRRR